MKKRVLWQISLVIAREAEEAGAALLERLFGQPAAIYSEEGKPCSVATVYSSQDSEKVRSKREALRSGLKFLSTCELEVGPTKIVIRKVPREDWATSWKKDFKLIEIGSALIIKPSWNKRLARKGQAVVVLDPGMSFGTGQHPTTAFCLQELVRARKSGHAQSFLDIGTGSGILAISAAKLGYQPVRALDFDPTAVRVAKANARKNRVEKKVAIVREDLTRAEWKGQSPYDLICANLVDDLLITEARRILSRLRRGGTLVLAGVLTDQFRRVQKTYEAEGLRLKTFRIEGGWQSGAFVSMDVEKVR